MTSVSLRTAARVLSPLILVFSAFLLLRGHDVPGGGFVGGLTAASALVLHSVAFGTSSARRALWLAPETLAAIGLAISGSVALAPLVLGQSALTAAWSELTLGSPDESPLGSPLLFEVGIYAVVSGTSLTLVFNLSEE